MYSPLQIQIGTEMLQEVKMYWEQGSSLKRFRDWGQWNWQGPSQPQHQEPAPPAAAKAGSAEGWREWHSWTRGRTLTDTPAGLILTPGSPGTVSSLLDTGEWIHCLALAQWLTIKHRPWKESSMLNRNIYITEEKTKIFLSLIRIFCFTKAKLFIWTVGFKKSSVSKKTPC